MSYDCIISTIYKTLRRACMYSDIPWSVDSCRGLIVSRTDCCCSSDSGHSMPGTSTRVLPRTCAMSAGTVVASTPTGTPCESNTSRTAVSWLVWFANIPKTNSCVGDFPRSVLRLWLFHCPRNKSRSAFIRGRNTKWSSHRSRSLDGSATYQNAILLSH